MSEQMISNNDELRKIAYAYNLCVVLSTQIIDYDDRYYLRQVYDEILNNINLESFPKDDALCYALSSLLTTIDCIDIQEDEKNFIEQKYQRNKENALWNAMPSPSIFLTGGSFAGIAINVLLSVGTAYMNYKKTLNSIESERIDNHFKIAKHQKEALNSHRRNLFKCAWTLTTEHPIPDEHRLSENDVSVYNKILKYNDLYRRYECLSDIKDRFEAYPPFWYNLGETARELYFDLQDSDYKSLAIDAFEHFKEVHLPLLRQDLFAASCTISHITLLDEVKEREKISELLDDAIRYSRDNYDLLQQCVPVALKIGDIDTARKLLKKLVNADYAIETNGKLLSLIYNRYDYNRKEYDILVKRIGSYNTFEWMSIKPQFRLDSFNDMFNKTDFSLVLGGGD